MPRLTGTARFGAVRRCGIGLALLAATAMAAPVSAQVQPQAPARRPAAPPAPAPARTPAPQAAPAPAPQAAPAPTTIPIPPVSAMTAAELQGVTCIVAGVMTAVGALAYSGTVASTVGSSAWTLPLLIAPAMAGGYAIGCSVGATTGPGAVWLYNRYFSDH